MADRPFIVVVDDDASVCKALQRLLQTDQMEAETHSSAESFLLCLERRQPDCLVLDIRMPGITGPELHRRLLGMGRSIPVVFITAHAEDTETARGPGAPEVLYKPFPSHTFLAAIARALGKPSG